jgi:hypothetical protein
MFEDHPDRFRQDLAEQLEVAVQKLEWKFGLSEAERKKLNLAGQADLRRFYERVEILRRKYRETHGDHKALLLVHRETVRVRVDDANRLFDDRSFLAKVAKTILSETASQRLEERRRQRLRSAAEQAVRQLERNAGLRPEQRETLVGLLLKENPPIDLGEDGGHVMKYRLTEFPLDQLKPLFDDVQWPRVQVVLHLFREHRPILEAQGLVDRHSGRLRSAAGGPTSAEKDRK